MATINACSRGKNTLKVTRSNERLPMFIINICLTLFVKSTGVKVNGPTCVVELSPKIGSSVDHWVYLKLGGIIEGLNSYLLP